MPGVSPDHDAYNYYLVHRKGVVVWWSCKPLAPPPLLHHGGVPLRGGALERVHPSPTATLIMLGSPRDHQWSNFKMERKKGKANTARLEDEASTLDLTATGWDHIRACVVMHNTHCARSTPRTHSGRP